MKLSKRKLKALIESYVLREVKTGDIEFSWGKYTSSLKDREYFFRDQDKLGSIQKNGDPYTYEKEGNFFVVVSGPKESALGQKFAIDSPTGQKISGESDDDQNIESNVIISASMLYSENIEKIESLLEDLKLIQEAIYNMQGRDITLSSPGLPSQTLPFNEYARNTIGAGRQPPGRFPSDVIKSLIPESKELCEEYNDIITEIKSLHKKALPEILNNIKVYSDQFDDAKGYDQKSVLGLIDSFISTTISVFPAHLGRNVDAPAISAYYDDIFPMTLSGSRIPRGLIFRFLYDLRKKLTGTSSADPVALGMELEEKIESMF